MVSTLALVVLAARPTYYLAVDRLLIGSLRGSAWKSLDTIENRPGKITFTKVGIGTVGGTRVVNGLVKGPPNDAGYIDVEEMGKFDGVLFSGVARVPRAVRILDNTNDAYVGVVKKFLVSKGLNSVPRITRVLMADLDGNGSQEVLIEASNRDVLFDHGMFGVKPGDYSLVLLRSLRRGRVIEVPLIFDHPKPEDLNYENKILAVADFDRNGSMEVVVSSRYYEGSAATLFGFNGLKVRKIVEMGDGV